MRGKRSWALGALALVAAFGLAACGASLAAKDTALPSARPLASPIADSPAAGICADFEGSSVTVTLGPDSPSPRCVRVTPTQRLTVENVSGQVRQVGIGPFTAEIPSGAARTFDTPLGDFLAPGVHVLSVSGPADSVEIWLVSSLSSATPGRSGPDGPVRLVVSAIRQNDIFGGLRFAGQRLSPPFKTEGMPGPGPSRSAERWTSKS